MKIPCALSACVRDYLAVAVLLTLCLPARAQVAAPGTIEGRVLNARNGEYLEGAHLTVPGTTLETFTDAAGSYRLSMVPAGTVQLTVFFTGLPSQTIQVAVAAGRTAQQDVSFGVAGARPTGEIVKLAEYRVETSREMEASALAINEQRFSSSIKNILSTEEFGYVSEGNAAEFLKFLPGVTIETTGGAHLPAIVGAGVQVFANGSTQRVTGDDTVSFVGFVPRSAGWGVSLNRPKYNVRVNWNYRGRSRNNLVTGNSIEPGTFNWASRRLYIDIVGEYTFWKRMAVFFDLRNIGDTTEDTKVFGPNTPAVATLRTRIDYASLWTFGVKGTF